ncbi:hypothetical protein ABEB36_010450 [Hypothenemus hampei]|uniref:Innexin n=1 Tax=Hypothenemus hampei TaxID=57062 RepID=A0ABD1EJS0_HYPHA
MFIHFETLRMVNLSARTMHEFVENFQKLVKCEEVRTDNNIFKLHYKFTVILFIVFSILLSSKQYFGDPIHCDVASQKQLVDVFCWATGTFIVMDHVNDKYYRTVGVEGLGNQGHKETYTLLYYQWICLLFCFQALLFYVPRYLWKAWEGDRLSQMVKDLCGPLISEKWSSTYKEKMTNFITTNDNHDVFAYRFAFCEFLNLCNLIIQCLFMDWYLNGKFSLYGYEVATKPWPQAYNRVFPKKTKCVYTKFGHSGSVVDIDALCVLPLNILNEKFFLIIWYWMIVMFVVTFGALIYRMLVLTWREFRIYLLMAQVRSVSRKKCRELGKHLTHGQFFLLYNIGKNMNPIIYKELVLSIYEHLLIRKSITDDADNDVRLDL